MQKQLNNIIVTCSPKLYGLFTRSFKNLEFIASEKLRGDDFNFSPAFVEENYSKVLGFDVLRVMDNKSVDAVDRTDRVVIVTDLLCKALLSYASFSGAPYLLHDIGKTIQFKRLLPKNKVLIGISWRSPVLSHARNEHYFNIEELAPLFSLNGCQFINFQSG